MAINERENRRLAPSDAVLVEETNQPQTMRVWPGLRVVGVGVTVAKGCFVMVREIGERFLLECPARFRSKVGIPTLVF
ncbi:GA20OX1 [Symbiodinium necroappetens]|uniref:GA20OX1 protein n=1 Tax=Symbiodinium necroappetens TaxID=1628268 RepID=A0A812LUP8_9DINO|nr:GA20OX1 [Symbiodinium necroappetens]